MISGAIDRVMPVRQVTISLCVLFLFWSRPCQASRNARVSGNAKDRLPAGYSAVQHLILGKWPGVLHRILYLPKAALVQMRG